ARLPTRGIWADDVSWQVWDRNRGGMMSCVGELSWEHALVTACLAGDGTAREQFAVLYRDMLRRFIRGCLGSIEDADNVGDDLTQNVWVRLVERAYEPLRDFDAS